MANSSDSANTIDQVIARLDEIITRSVQESSREGYFAALYRKVTVRLKEGIVNNRFEHGAKIERLDVIFANRYFEALERYRRKKPASQCWEVSFRALPEWRPLILQHLLTGINAHINLDLAIAVAEITAADELPALKSDFDQVNRILVELVDQIQGTIDQVSPWLRFLDRVGGRTDEEVIKFSLSIARAESWRMAARLTAAPKTEWAKLIEQTDQKVADLGRLILHPGYLLSAGLLAIRLRETSDVRRIIEVLNRS